jgi:hypothetical protein
MNVKPYLRRAKDVAAIGNNVGRREVRVPNYNCRAKRPGVETRWTSLRKNANLEENFQCESSASLERGLVSWRDPKPQRAWILLSSLLAIGADPQRRGSRLSRFVADKEASEDVPSRGTSFPPRIGNANVPCREWPWSGRIQSPAESTIRDGVSPLTALSGADFRRGPDHPLLTSPLRRGTRRTTRERGETRLESEASTSLVYTQYSRTA